MKNKTVLFFTAFLFLLDSCSKHVIPTAETSFLSTQNGVLNVRATGYCTLVQYKDQCEDSAQINAFRILFYRGIPGSQQNTPLISTDEKEMAANQSFIKTFFSSGRYKSFIVSSSTVSEVVKQRKRKKITVDLGINLSALRKELEQNKIIPKFGLN